MTSSPENGLSGTLPRLHVVTDESLLRETDFAARATAVLHAGRAEVALHLRGGGLPTRLLWKHAEHCAREAATSGAWLVINDRLDIALASGAAAVQLGTTSFSADTAREIMGPRVALGVSVHTVDEARAAILSGADFLLAGTVFSTPSHPERTPAGVQWLALLAPFGKPVIAIGGVDPARVPEVLQAGAYGIAAIRGVWRTPDPAEAVHRYLLVLRREG